MLLCSLPTNVGRLQRIRCYCGIGVVLQEGVAPLINLYSLRFHHLSNTTPELSHLRNRECLLGLRIGCLSPHRKWLRLCHCHGVGSLSPAGVGTLTWVRTIVYSIPLVEASTGRVKVEFEKCSTASISAGNVVVSHKFVLDVCYFHICNSGQVLCYFVGVASLFTVEYLINDNSLGNVTYASAYCIRFMHT